MATDAPLAQPRVPAVRSEGRRWPWLALIGAVVVVGFLVTVSTAGALLRPAPPPVYRIQMAADTVPLRVHMAEEIRRQAARHSLDVVFTSKNFGALEALEEVDSPSDIKLALVPGGVRAREYPRVRLVATLTIEPLHVLVRPELAAKGFAGMRGKRVALGPPTMASHHVAREILSFVGLKPATEVGTKGYKLDEVGPDDLRRELQRIGSLGEDERAKPLQVLPDAVVFLAPTPSILARELVQTGGYQLLPIPFAEAFCNERLNPPNAAGVQINRAVLTQTTIPAYTYGADPPAPARPCPTIGVPLQLVAQDAADPEAVVRLLETIYDSPLKNQIRPQPLENQVSTFPLHPGTEKYLRRNDPLLKPEHASKLGTLLGGLGTLITGLIALNGYRQLRKLKRFEAYYLEISRIELLARGLEVDPAAPTEPVTLRVHLETRLAQLKHDVLKDFAEGGLNGEALMTGVIALINDTRESLAQMVPGGHRSPGTAGAEAVLADDSAG